MVLRDHRNVGSSDVCFNYFLREEDIGKNRAECAAKRVQEMNPLCTVAASGATIEASDAAGLKEAVKGHDVVIVSPSVLGWDMERARGLDAACRESGTVFALVLSCGELSFFFTDLAEHTVQEHSSAQGGAGQVASESNAEPETLHFPSFDEWLECTPAELLQRKADASFVLISLFIAFLRGGAGQPKPEAAAKFEDYCKNVAKCAPAVDGFASLQDAYRLFFVEPLMHVASIAGGLLAQEVIKAITKRDTPLVNCVCFNANTSAALVERIPAQQSAAKKRKVEVAEDILD